MLPCGYKVAYLLDSPLHDEIFAFFFADLFTEFLLGLPGDFNTRIFHGLIDNAAEIDFRIALVREIVNGGAFPGARKTDKSDKDCVVSFCH